MLWLAGGVRSIDDRVSSGSSPNGGWLDEGNIVRRGGTNTVSPAPQWQEYRCVRGYAVFACVFLQPYSSNAIHGTFELDCTVIFPKADACRRLQ